MSISNVMSRSLVSASSSIKMARMQNAVKRQMEGHAGVLKAEIKQDKGKSPEKEKELEETEKKAAEVKESTMNALSEMNNNLKEAAKEDLAETRAEKAAEKKKAEKAAEKKKAEKEKQEEARRTNVDEQAESADEETTVAANADQSDPTAVVAEGATINIVSEGITPSSGAGSSIGVKLDLKA
ncbi:MAG: hypothetical protein K5696_04445 [Lachnospiraceae bacterium]|nr:hypothetical protein [Lachnospiraceae bacterium]